MHKTSKLALLFVAIVIIVTAIMFGWRHWAEAPSPPSSTTSKSQMSATITYDGDSFEPETITVSAGGTLKIINQSQENIVVIPNQTTAQAATNEIAVGNVDPGVSKTITLTTKGNWGFFNQKHPTEHAAIIVK